MYYWYCIVYIITIQFEGPKRTALPKLHHVAKLIGTAEVDFAPDCIATIFSN